MWRSAAEQHRESKGCSVEESNPCLLVVGEGSCRWTNGAGASGGTCTRRDLVLGQARLLDCATLAGKLEAERSGQEVRRGRVKPQVPHLRKVS